MSFAEIENTGLDFLLNLEVIDSKVEAAFEQQRHVTRGWQKEFVWIDQIF